MRGKVSMFPLALVVLMCGCVTSRDIVRSAESYNFAVEKAQTEMLLLNVLRAMDHEPLFLTDMAKLNGSMTRTVSGTASAGLATTWNDGGAGPFHSLMRPFSAAPTVGMTDSPSFEVDVLSTQDFMQGFLRPVSGAEFNYYLQGGWPPELLFDLLVERVDLVCKPVTEGGVAATRSWSNHPSPLDSAPLDGFNGLLLKLLPRTGTEPQIEVVQAKPSTIGTFTQLPLKDLLAADAAGFTITVISPTAWQIDKPGSDQLLLKTWGEFEKMCPDPKAPGATSKSASVTRGFFTHAASAPLMGQAEKKPDTTKNPDSLVQAVTFDLRSPEGVLYYLGQLARVENSGTSTVPLSWDGYRKRPIFVIRKGTCSAAAEACVTYRGESYIVPKRDNGGEKDAASESNPATATGGESMHSLSLLTQLIALQKSAKDFQSTPVVRLIGQ